MKELYTFKLDKDKEVEIFESCEINGETVEVKKKITQATPVKFVIKKPNRSELEDIELQYDVEFSKLVKAGVLTRAMIYKQYAEQGGIWTREEEGTRNKLMKEYGIKLQAYHNKIKPDTVIDDEMLEMAHELAKLEEDINKYQSVEESLYGNCADQKARNKVINYLIPLLSYVQEDEKKEPVKFFVGETLEEQWENYDEKAESDDKFFHEAIRFFAFFITMWYLNRARTKEEFESIEKDFRRNIEKEKGADEQE